MFNTKRSLREILPKKEGVVPPTTVVDERLKSEQNIIGHAQSYSSSSNEYNRPPRSSAGVKILAWLLIIILVIIIGYAVSAMFVTATIKVTPRQAGVMIENTFQTSKTAPINDLDYGIMTGVRLQSSRQVPATGVEKVERKAAGRVTIFNEFSADAQVLVKNTRVATDDGKIYRIQEAVKVPGMKGSVPGSIEVLAMADKAGDTYNIGQTNLKIPGFIGGPRYDKFYAKTVDSMTGGFIGDIKKISKDDRAKAKEEIEKELQDKVLAQAKTKVPKDFILFDNATFIKFREVEVSSATGSDSNMAVITEEAELSGLVFNVDKLATFLAKNMISDFDGSSVTLVDPSGLEFRLMDKEKIDLATVDTITFSLKGRASFLWKLDEGALKDKMLSVKNGDYVGVFGQFTAIDRAEIKFSPSWIRSFPKDPKKIKVEYTNINKT
ncbi:MAG: hypothetical protein WCO03_02955 [bacterium]